MWNRTEEVAVTGKALKATHTIDLGGEHCLSTGPSGQQSSAWRCDLVWPVLQKRMLVGNYMDAGRADNGAAHLNTREHAVPSRVSLWV